MKAELATGTFEQASLQSFWKKICKYVLVYHAGMKQSEKSGRVQIPGKKEEPRDDDELPVVSLRSCWPKDFLGGVDETRLASYVIRKILIFFLLLLRFCFEKDTLLSSPIL